MQRPAPLAARTNESGDHSKRATQPLPAPALSEPLTGPRGGSTPLPRALPSPTPPAPPPGSFAAPAGTLAGDSIPVSVYVPDGPPPPGGWPVLYLLHGYNGNERSWVDQGAIVPTLDRLIRDKVIKPVLVVMPGAGNSWYVDSTAIDGPGDWDTAISHDLVEAVEAAYPVRRERGQRAIAGLSMGGFGALRLAMAHPDRYVAVASLSGAIWNNIPTEDLDMTPAALDLAQEAAYYQQVGKGNFTAGIILPSVIPHFNGAFGTPFEPRRFNAENIFTLLATDLAERRQLPGVYLTVGDKDNVKLWRGAVRLFETLQMAHQPSELRITAGDHVWALWKVTIVDVLRWLDTRWEDEQTRASVP